MKHFGIIEWADFARNVANQRECAAMHAHLAAGCLKCQGIADFCKRLSLTCRNMAVPPMPEEAVWRAKSIFQARPPVKPERFWRIPVKLVYDSFLVPAPAGLRSSWQLGWQALYQSGECTLDLRVEPELHSGRASIIGQISNHQAPETEMVDITVCLKSGELVVAETRSNRFGEFQMEYEQQKRLQLFVYLEGGSRCIQVPLKRFVTETPVGGNRLKRSATAKRQPSEVSKRKTGNRG